MGKFFNRVLLIIVFVFTVSYTPSSVQGTHLDELHNPNKFTSDGLSYNSTADVVAEVIPSVVYIFVTHGISDNTDGDFGGLMPSNNKPIQGVGTGFFINDDGFLVTNAHVVQGAAEITIYYWTSPLKFNKAQIVGIDLIADVAVLKIDNLTPTTYVTWGNSEEMRLGMDVIAIGHGMSMPWTVTKGIISMTDRQKPGVPMIVYNQSDAVINSGNSGGPLFNMKGEVIGINTLLFSKTGVFSGVGFSLPSVLAERSVNHIMNTVVFDDDGNVATQGFVTYPAIGIMLSTIEDREYREQLLKDGIRSVVEITDAPIEGAAYEAGLLPGDLLLRVGNNKNIITSLDVIKQLWYNEVGDELIVTVLRDGIKLDFTVILKEFKFSK